MAFLICKRGCFSIFNFQPSQILDHLHKRPDFFGKGGAFGRGDPLQPQTALIDSQQPEQFSGFFDDLLAFYITLQVMTVADVSAGHQDAVGALDKSLEQKSVIHPAGAHEPDQAHMGRVLHPGHPGQVGPGIGAPVADEG